MQDESHNDMTIFSGDKHFPNENSNELKIIELLSLYKIMHYILCGGRKKTPLHVWHLLTSMISAKVEN